MAGCIKTSIGTAVILSILLMPTCPVAASDLKEQASQAFEQYVRFAERSAQSELRPGGHFLHIDSLDDSARHNAYDRLQRGEVFTERIGEQNEVGRFQTPGAMIHNWIGTVWVPGATMQQVLAVVQDYDHHAAYYSPQVQKSKLLAHTSDDYSIYLRLMQKDLITVVFDTEHEVHYTRLDAAHVFSHSHATRIAEVANPGKSGEHDLGAGEDHGFLWRLESYWRFFDTGHGVYIQCEAISLARDIPLGLEWIVSPFIGSVPKDSLEFTLSATRSAVLRAISPHQ